MVAFAAPQSGLALEASESRVEGASSIGKWTALTKGGRVRGDGDGGEPAEIGRVSFATRRATVLGKIPQGELRVCGPVRA